MSSSRGTWRTVAVGALLVGVVALLVMFGGPEMLHVPSQSPAHPASPQDPMEAPALAGIDEPLVEDSSASPSPPVPSAGPGATGAEDVLRGRVVDAQDPDRAIQGAHVHLGAAGSYIPWSTGAKTDANGFFELGRPSQSEVRLSITATGYRTWSEGVTRDSKELVVKLQRGASVRGRVLDDTGSPIHGVRVWAFLRENAFGWPHGRQLRLVGRRGDGGVATTNASGEFEIRGLDGETTYVIRAAKRYWTSITEEDVRASPGASRIELRLVPMAVLKLRVLEAETGRPIKHPTVSMSLPPGTAPRNRTAYAGLTTDASEDTGTRPFQLLRYRVDEIVEPLAVRVRIAALGFDAADEQVELVFGEEVVRTVTMAPIEGDTAHEVSVRAAWRGGRPFSGRLELRLGTAGARGPHGVALEFVNGVATESLRLPPGSYNALPVGLGPRGIWWEEAGPHQSLTVVASDSQQIWHIQLEGSVVRLRVVSPDGRELRGYSLAVEAPGGHSAYRKHWDINNVRVPASSGALEPASVFVGPGHIKVHADVAAIGRAVGELDAAGDGQTYTLKLVLR